MSQNNSKIIEGFQVAGADKKFYWAKATISEEDNSSLILECREVKSAVSIRFAWTDDASNVNLFNKDGFPAIPFRTDKWEGITFKNKYTVQ